MSLLYIFRHGQAGTRDDYDRLSDLGREQASLLGRYFAQEKMRFDAFICGPLQRQIETAGLVHAEIGGPAPEIDPHWAEFDLDAVAAEIAPHLAAADPAFAEAYAAAANSHRHWTPADTQVVRAWVEGRYPTRTESWRAFNERVAGARERLAAFPADARIAVATSATPMSIWIALALELKPLHIMKLAGASLNTCYSVLRLGDPHLDLLAYNAVPHLNEPRLRTLR